MKQYKVINKNSYYKNRIGRELNKQDVINKIGFKYGRDKEWYSKCGILLTFEGYDDMGTAFKPSELQQV